MSPKGNIVIFILNAGDGQVRTESCSKCDARRQNPMEVSTSVVWLVVMIEDYKGKGRSCPAFRLSFWFLLDGGLAGG
jgi:hypothetical protein